MKPALLLLPLLLAACGGRGDLTPAAGQALPATAYGTEEPSTAGRLLALPPEARPAIASELLKRSEPRESDRFDLPPPQ